MRIAAVRQFTRKILARQIRAAASRTPQLTLCAPVSYTHLDVYKRQENTDRLIHEADRGQEKGAQIGQQSE